MNEIKDNLVSVFKARLPGVHIRSLEEDRVIEALRQTVTAVNQKMTPRVLQKWSSVSGLWKLDASGEREEPFDVPVQEQCAFDEVLTMFKNKESKDTIILALCDPWDELARPIYQRHLREALDFARGSGNVIVLIGRDWKVPVELMSNMIVLDLPLPSRADLTEYIRSLAVIFAERLADKAKIEINDSIVPELARACSGLTLYETKNIVSLSLVKYKAINIDSVKLALSEKSQIVRRSGLLEYEEPDKGMNDVGGLSNLKAWLTKRATLFTDEAAKAGIRAPKGVLLVGIPGCGKTLCARAISAAWNQPLVRLDVGKLFGSLVGESESNLRGALRTAEAVSPCVLLIDEIEKGFGSNGGTGDGGTSQRVFGALLSWMEDKKFPVFVVGTANVIEKLDPALIRRFDSVFAVDLPSEDGRVEILEIHLRRAGYKIPRIELEDLVKISTGFTGSEIETAVQSALIEAFNANRKLDLIDLGKAFQAVVPISKSMGQSIDQLREFCKSGRAVSAGGSLELDAVKAKKKGAGLDL